MNSTRIKITKDCIVKRTTPGNDAYDIAYSAGETFEFPSNCVKVEGLGFWLSPRGENHGLDSKPGDVWVWTTKSEHKAPVPTLAPSACKSIKGYCSACQHLDDEEYCVKKCDDKHNGWKPKTAPTPDTAPIDAMAYCRELEVKLSNTNRRYNSLAIDRDNINKRLEKLESEKGCRLAELDKRLSALEKLISVLEKLTVADLLPILSHLFNNDMKRAREMFDTLLERYSK